jgi:hypothetical protein
MSIVDAPFVGIAVPLEFSPISKAYWQTDAAVKEIAIRFSLTGDKQVMKRAGHARLLGIACKDCGKDMVVKNRGQAITEIGDFNKSGPKYNRVQCNPCFQIQQQNRFGCRPKRTWADKKPEILQAVIERSGKQKKANPSAASKDEFYKSWEWRTVRMEVLKEQGRSCQCCGATPGMTAADGAPVRIVVDHIKPISKYWHLRLERSNLQILCDECNMGKGNWDETDFRPPAAPDEWVIEDGVSQDLIDQLTDRTTGTLQ